MSTPRFVVVGGGITGLTAAYRLSKDAADASITLIEGADRLGGKISASPFAGIDGIDEGADAFLTRVPDAMNLADELGLSTELTSPATASASVWWNGLHPIPEGLLLGVPTDVLKLARSKLLTWPGKLRAAMEPILPATGVGSDCVGKIIRKRFGKQVHERLVDPLVGSIYAADTDRFSLAGVPQILDLASNNRSLLLGARAIRAKAAPVTGPIFATPRGGMPAFTDALGDALRVAGVDLRLGNAVESVTRSTGGDGGWVVNLVSGDSVECDGIILATPARMTAPLLAALSPAAATSLATFEHASVVMVALAIASDDWPRGLYKSSGYLVPKPVQKWVTAVSFASNKWAHWNPVDADGHQAMVLRVSMGRDGRDVTDETDDALLAAAIGEVGGHLGLELEPFEHRITRWPMSFPQYRPGHTARVDAIEQALAADAPGIVLAGASYRGIGIPACINQGNRAALALRQIASAVRD